MRARVLLAFVLNKPDGEVLFFENFDDQDAFDNTWTISTHSEFTGARVMHLWPLVPSSTRCSHAAGAWGLSEGKNAVQSGDLGLEVKNEARRHGAPP